MRYAARTDSNQAAIVKAWRRMGKMVILAHRQGDGAPDCYLLHMGVWLAVEFKTEKGKLTDDQKQLHQKVRDKGGTIYVIRNLDEAMALVGAKAA